MYDPSHMRAALALAGRGLGVCWPNPSVGCVIVKHGRVVGRGATAPGGRPHAETQALAMAGEAARGATAYVTLEPCNHTGQTPPCTEALIAAGIAHVVVAGGDPDPRVDGGGIRRLRAAGVEVTTGVLTAQADEMQAGFLTRIPAGAPVGDAETGHHLGRADCHQGRGEPMDHGRDRPLRRPCAARAE